MRAKQPYPLHQLGSRPGAEMEGFIIKLSILYIVGEDIKVNTGAAWVITHSYCTNESLQT